MSLKFGIQAERPAQTVSAINPLGRGKDDSTPRLRHYVVVLMVGGNWGHLLGRMVCF